MRTHKGIYDKSELKKYCKFDEDSGESVSDDKNRFSCIL